MTDSLSVLIIEDSEDDFELIKREIRRAGFETVAERVETAPDMRSALSSHQWDVIISDHKMPSFNAPAALKILKESGLDIPFIVVSGAIGEEVAVSLMREGAHDFVMKDRLGRLVPAIEREMREAQIRLERKEAVETELRLTQQLQAEHKELQQRVTELSALNDMFQQHLCQYSEMEEAYNNLVKALHQMRGQVTELITVAESYSPPESRDIVPLIAAGASI